MHSEPVGRVRLSIDQTPYTIEYGKLKRRTAAGSTVMAGKIHQPPGHEARIQALMRKVERGEKLSFS